MQSWEGDRLCLVPGGKNSQHLQDDTVACIPYKSRSCWNLRNQADTIRMHNNRYRYQCLCQHRPPLLLLHVSPPRKYLKDGGGQRCNFSIVVVVIDVVIKVKTTAKVMKSLFRTGLSRAFSSLLPPVWPIGQVDCEICSPRSLTATLHGSACGG